MIPWGWLLVTLFGGAAAGVCALAMCVVGGREPPRLTQAPTQYHIELSESREEVTPDGDV